MGKFLSQYLKKSKKKITIEIFYLLCLILTLKTNIR